MLLFSNVYTQTEGVWTLSISLEKKKEKKKHRLDSNHHPCALLSDSEPNSFTAVLYFATFHFQTRDLTFTVHHVLWTADQFIFFLETVNKYWHSNTHGKCLLPNSWDRKIFIPRLLPKKIFREPFGLPKLEIGSPRYISRSPWLFSQIQTMSYETYSLERWSPPPPGGPRI